ncbi:MAG TPA: ISAs1 family transposase [Chloroflexota bacterium]|nr:ISAs1 family transposase [Chloroflexota bacterium]
MPRVRKPLPTGPPAPAGTLAAALAAVPDPRRPYGWRPEFPPVPLVALDGKTLRGTQRHVTPAGEVVPAVHLVAAYAHHAQAVLAQVLTPGKGQELAAWAAVLEQLPLTGRVVAADSLLIQRAICQQIVDRGGDYVVPVKENQPMLFESLERTFSPLAAQWPRRDGATSHS